MVTSVLALLIFAAPAAVKLDPYVMREVRWETVPEENGDTGKVTLPDGRSVTLRLVRAGGSDELRATCLAKTKPARYLLAGPALVMGSYPEPVRDSRGRWVFASTVELAGDPARRTWALDAPRCRIERLTSSLDAAGFDRFEFARSKPEDARAWLTDHSPFTPAQQSWLVAEGLGPANAAAWLDRYRTLRPPAAKGRQQTDLPPGGGRRTTIEGPDGKESVWSTEQAHWKVTGPARLVISARRLGDAESLCLTIGADSYCQAPAPEIITGIEGGAIAVKPAVLRELSFSQPVAWRVLLGEGEHILGLSGPAVVRATRAELWREGSLPAVPPAQPVVYPPTCLPGAEENACRAPGATVSADGDPSEVLLASPSVPGASPEQTRWVEIEEARAILSTGKGSWVDERGTSSFWIAGPPTGSTSEDERCVVTFPDGSRFVSRPEQGVVRFAWNGPAGSEGAMPAFTGCRVWVSISRSPDDDPALLSPALSLRRFQRIPPGAMATWRVPEPSAPTAVWLAWPQGERGPIDVIAHFERGESRTTRVFPLQGTPTVLAPDGLPWQPPGRFSLGAGVTRLEVRTNSLCAARVTQTAVAKASASPEKYERALAGGALLGEVRRLSAGIAHAKSESERSFLLLERATLLEGAGFDSLALDDLRLAKQGNPTLSAIPTVTVERAMARVLAPSGRNSWMALDAAWMKEREGAPLGRELLGSARSGNYVDVARTGEAIALDERLRAWRRAVTGGQVLTADQRARSFLDLVDATGEIPMHPLFWPLRSLSSWESVIKVDGAKPVKASPFQLVEEAGLERVQAALFPEEWPSHQVATLEGDRELAFPRDTVSDLQVRCRATSAENVSQPCAFELVDRKGAVLAQASADPWGPAVTLTSPKDAGAVFLIARPARGAVKQVLLPPAVAQPLFDDARRAWRLESGAAASLEVLGPTVVRVAARNAGSSSATLSWEVRGAKSSRRVGGDDTVVIPVPHTGPVTLSLRADAPVIFAAEMRVPRARSMEPPDDVRLLLQTAGNRSGSDAIRGGAPELPSAQRTYRPQPFPLTIYAGMGAGSEQALDETTFDTRYRRLFEAGITSRLGKLPLWGNAEADGIGLGDRESVRVERAGFDWLPVRGRWDIWLTADAQLAQGSPGDVALSSHEETARLQVGRWNTPQWLLYGRVRGTNRAILDGEDRRGTGFGEQPILWSTYRDDHPQALAGAIGTRYVFGQWVLANAAASATTNPSDDETSPLDHADLEASADLSAPRVWLRVGGVLERRFADDHRLENAWNPVLEARASGMVWPIGDVGMQLAGDVRYQTETKDVATFVTLRLYLSRDRGLRDLRPSRFASRDTAGWDQDRAAVRQYEVEEPQ